MKKFILSALLGFASLAVFAQSFVSQHGDTVSANYSSGFITVYNHLKSNIPNDSVYIKWRISSHNLPNNWSLYGFCDNVTCYLPDAAMLNGTSSQVSDPYNAGQWENFYAQFDGDNAPLGSSAWITVQAQDTVHLQSRTFTFIATKYATGVSTVVKSDDNIMLYPNPAKNNVNVVFDASLGVKNIAIYNLIGKAVKVFKVSGNSAKLEINEIPSGIYFVRLINAQGQIVATRKFTHQ
ncbi:MAG TPA: T9SS type A sorting domain-containing protein [Flavipsychrobacter sp.]|nr:T9SS type A sorting domain-containing protein [Flavipsychrobacter sp.]